MAKETKAASVGCSNNPRKIVPVLSRLASGAGKSRGSAGFERADEKEQGSLETTAPLGLGRFPHLSILSRIRWLGQLCPYNTTTIATKGKIPI